jgi:tight adherence protein B
MTSLLPFLLVFGVFMLVGMGLAIALVSVRRTRRELERRTGLVSGRCRSASSHGAASAEELREPDWRDQLGARLRAVFSVGLARTWGTRAAPLVLLVAWAGGACVTWLALRSGLHMSTWVSLAGALAASFLAPRSLLKREQSQADYKFMESFPDAIDMIIRMLRAGVPISGAVRSVGDEAPPPIDAVFTNLADQMAIGITFEDALTVGARRVGLPDFQFFAVAVTLQRATGGNLASTLEILSDIMRKRRAMRMKARATTGEVRMSAYVLAGIPFFVIGGLLFMTPDYLQPLISDPRGNVIIAVAVGNLLAGLWIMRRMLRSVTNV